MIRHSFSSLSVKDNYDLVPIVDTAPWRMNTMERPPSEILLAILV